MTSTSPATGTPPRRRRRVRYLDGDKLLALRIRLQLSQGDVALKVGGNATQSLISAWERGRQGTSLANVHHVAGVLGVPAEALMPDDLLARISAAAQQAA